MNLHVRGKHAGLKEDRPVGSDDFSLADSGDNLQPICLCFHGQTLFRQELTTRDFSIKNRTEGLVVRGEITVDCQKSSSHLW